MGGRQGFCTAWKWKDILCFMVMSNGQCNGDHGQHLCELWRNNGQSVVQQTFTFFFPTKAGDGTESKTCFSISSRSSPYLATVPCRCWTDLPPIRLHHNPDWNSLGVLICYKTRSTLLSWCTLSLHPRVAPPASLRLGSQVPATDSF